MPREADDLAACKAILARGSKSFALASLLLPKRVREPAAALYAFCRVADDAVDGAGGSAALGRLRDRLERIVADRPHEDPVDRALARVVALHHLPRAPLDALLEGFEWDLEGRVYDTIEELHGYGARVAGTIGVLMTLLMGRRSPEVLARACDLGVAMQLTNIARDVGDDARSGRVYLPRQWLHEAGVSSARLLTEVRPLPELRPVVRRVIAEADRLYARADAGVPSLPRDCRPAIRAARLIYADLHRSIARLAFDTVSSRAFVSTPRKLWLALRAVGALPASRARALPDPAPLPAAEFLLARAS